MGALLVCLTASPVFASDEAHTCVHVGAEGHSQESSDMPEMAMAEVASLDYSAEVTTIWRSGPSENRLDIVFLGDGYTEEELVTYHSHVQRALDFFFDEEPFKSFKHLINIHRVDVISSESGIDNDPSQGIRKDTALGARLWCFGSQRSLCVNINSAQAFAANAEDVDQIIVSANSRSYGGLGYTHSGIATFTGGNILSPELLLHEFAHSFGLLADEYDGTGNIFSGNEPSLLNVTSLSGTELIDSGLKWADWLGYDAGDGTGRVGLYEGTNLFSFGLFRPTLDSKMRTLGMPFNAPSMEAMVEQLFRSAGPIENAYPESLEVSSNQTLFLDVIEDISGHTEVSWFLDGEKLPASDIQIEPAEFIRAPGSYQFTAEVQFKTPFVRSKAASEQLSASYTWTVEHVATSTLVQRESTVRCSFPNSFLGQVNIASLVNNGSNSLNGELVLLDSLGVVRGDMNLSLKPGQKSDVSLFDLGLLADEIGAVCFSSDSDSWAGNLNLYAPGTDGQGFDFAISYPFLSPETGTSTVPVNTFHLVPGEDIAYNWIRVIDGQPGDGKGLLGVVNYYNEVGVLIGHDQIDLVDGGRLDLAAHLYYGPSRVGHAEFVSSQEDAPFYFEATRYYPSRAGGYYSAMPLQRRAPSLEPMKSSFSQTDSELNIVEIFNASETESNTIVVVRDSSGSIVSSDTLVLEAKGSFHFILDEFEDRSGTVTVVGDSPIASRLLAYVYDQDSLVCGSSARAMSRDSSTSLVGEFNTFIEQRNLLNLTNRSGEVSTVRYEIVDVSGRTIGQGELSIDGFGSSLVPLELPTDTYGSIILESDNLISAETIVDSPENYQLIVPAR